MSPPQEWLEQPATKPERKGTHVMVPAPMAEAFGSACLLKRWSQGDCMGDAVRALFAKVEANGGPGLPPILPEGPMTSVVCRLPAEVKLGLKNLATDTRIKQSDLLREALNDWLHANGAAPWLESDGKLDAYPDEPALRLVEGG